MAFRWNIAAARFLTSLQRTHAACSRPGGPVTLYGTCYSLSALHYLGCEPHISDEVRRFIASTQDMETGLFIGPELVGFRTAPGVIHDREHLLLHLTCAVLPFCQQHSIPLRFPIRAAHRFCEPVSLNAWMNARDWRHAWFEGNNILFVGQLLVYLRDVEKHPRAADALKLWFEWLNGTVDPKTGLWGTNGFCSPMEAVYGGYHQLLVYYYENQPLPNAQGLINTVLDLQHQDGGFNPGGNAGACEDVDSVDILVNCYKRLDYRRAEIRHALRHCLRHILSTQNPDGGFPYNRNHPQTHMGIPGTEAPPNVSCTFPTWFRIHTLALIAQILPNEPSLKGIEFGFNTALGMGWHRNPPHWSGLPHPRILEERIASIRHTLRALKRRSARMTRAPRRVFGETVRALRRT